MTGVGVKQAATQRVFGFEIMPAPFVCRSSAGRHHDARLRRSPIAGRYGAGGGLPHQRPDWLGAFQHPEAVTLPVELEQSSGTQAERVKQDTFSYW